MGMILHDAAYSMDNRDSATNLIVYTIKQSNIGMTSASEGFIREFVMTLATPANMIQFKKLELAATPVYRGRTGRSGANLRPLTIWTTNDHHTYDGRQTDSNRRPKAQQPFAGPLGQTGFTDLSHVPMGSPGTSNQS